MIDPGSGKKFDVWERRSHHQERVASFDGILRRFGSEQADAAGGIGAVIRHSSFTQQSFDDRGAEHLRQLFQFLSGMQSALAGQYRDLLSAIENIRGVFQFDSSWNLVEVGRDRRGVMDRVPLRSALLDLLNLHVHGNGDVSHASGSQSRADREIGHAFHMRSAHDSLVIDRDIHEELIQRYVLLGKGTNQIAVLKSCDRKNRSMIHLRVIEAIQEMNAARARRWQYTRRACR